MNIKVAAFTVSEKSSNTHQNNTKVLFRIEGHRPIKQNSHNTVLTRNGKLKVHLLFILLNKI